MASSGTPGSGAVGCLLLCSSPSPALAASGSDKRGAGIAVGARILVGAPRRAVVPWKDARLGVARFIAV
jgi:hypothetical protein